MPSVMNAHRPVIHTFIYNLIQVLIFGENVNGDKIQGNDFGRINKISYEVRYQNHNRNPNINPNSPLTTHEAI